MRILKLLLATTIAIIILATTVLAAEYPGLVRVDKAEDYVITGIDGTGNEWSKIDCTEDWQHNDLAAVIFDDNDTPNYIYDDKIIKMQYVGTVDLYMVPESK